MKFNSGFSLHRFLFSRFCAALGDQILMFAVPLVILKQTGSVGYSGLAFAIEWAPRLLLLPLSGTLADRVDVRKLYRFADGTRVPTVLAASALLWIYPGSIFTMLSTMMAVLGICHSLAFISMEATLPRQLSASEMPAAQAILQGSDQLSQVLGPAVAALAVSFISLETLIALASVSFTISFLNALSLPMIEAPKATGPWSLKLIGETYSQAFQIVRLRPILIQLCSLTWIINMVYGTILIVLPAIILQTYQLPERTFGILQTVSAIASIGAFFLVPRLQKAVGLVGMGAIASVFAMGGSLMASTSPWFLLFAAGSIAALASSGLFNVYIRTTRAQIIPKEHLGKTTGLIILINNASLPLNGVLISGMASSLSPSEILGILSFVAASLFILVLAAGKYFIGYKTIMPSLEFEAPRQTDGKRALLETLK